MLFRSQEERRRGGLWPAAQRRGKRGRGGQEGKREREQEKLTGLIERIENEKRGEDLDIIYICMWAKFNLNISNLGLLVGLRIYIT